MISQDDPQPQYVQEAAEQATLLQQQQKKRTLLGWLRLTVFVATTLTAYKLFQSSGLIGLPPAVTGIAILLYLVLQDLANNIKIRNTKLLIRINEEEQSALKHQFLERDNGSRFLPKEHGYAADLDLFGEASIYQWLSRCYTEQGQNLLAQNLLQPQPLALVKARQEAVKELTPLLQWRQQFQAFAMQTTMTQQAQNRVMVWTADEEKHFRKPAWKIVVWAYTFFTLASAIAALSGFVSGAAFSGLFLLYVLVSGIISRNAVKPYAQLSGIVKETSTLQNLVAWIEAHSFNASHLKTIQQSLTDGGKSASQEIKNLNRILDRFDLRGSLIGLIFLNPFLLWDVRQMIALNGWRKRNKTHLTLWFAAVAEIELLHSLSTLHFNQPRWCSPAFSAKHFTLHGKDIGHPLLKESKRVTNDFTLDGGPKVGLITGSNMAGKSTFLRSLGTNIVLAQTGAPVCASSFTLSPIGLLSSMRIADNLAENTSTFYAELKKLRTIIERIKTAEPVFILLDEILRGTNSYDRHKGSAAFIRQLIKEKAVAVIATHDVELALIETDYPAAVENYHFDVQVEGEELYFDYKLKPGVCQSLNASLLMKKIGIDLDE